MHRRVRGWFMALLGLLVLVVAPGRVARAQLGGGPMPKHFPHAAPTPPPSAAGPAHIRVTLEDGSRGPLVLAPRNGGYIGEFLVWNDGPGPLTVSRVTTRGDEDDPRLPPRVNARFADGGGGSSVVQAHASKRVRVTWIPDREPKLREALGHIVLTSNDESAGEVAMGFVSPLEGPLSFFTAHLLTWLLVLPFLGAILALGMHLVRYDQPDRLRGVLLGITAVQCLLAILLYEGFNGIVTRVDGNDGFQFLERVVLVRTWGVEYYVGVDGTNVSLVLLTTVLGFAGAIASFGLPEAGVRYFGLFALLLASVLGVFVALDLALFVACWVVMLGALVGLLTLRRAPAARASHASLKLAVYGAASALLLAFAAFALYRHSDPSYLGDGTRVEHTLAIPELMRVAYNAKHLTLLGASWVKVVWVVLFVAFAIVTPLVPLHGWFIDVLGETPAPVSAVLVGVVMKAGLYGFLRISFGILPDGSRWAATTLVAFGVATVAFGAVSALRQSDLVKLAAYAALGQTGFCLLGLGGLTREGIAGCLFQMVSHGAVMATLVLLAFAVRDRAKTSELATLALALRPLPIAAVLVAGALLAAGGVPGSAGFWGISTTVLGAFPAQRALATVAAAFGALALGHHGWVVRRALRESGPASKPRTNETAKPAVLDLGARELAAVLPLILIGLALAVDPAPFFILVQGGVSDLNQLVNRRAPTRSPGRTSTLRACGAILGHTQTPSTSAAHATDGRATTGAAAMRNRTRTALTDPTSGRSLARSDAGSGEVRPGELPVRSGTFPVAPEAAGPAEEELASSDPAPGMARELTSLRRFKDDALGLLVDQLNSPLAAMMMNLDFALTELARIASHADASLARNALSESRVTGGQVFRNIANLLDIARHDEGRLQPRGVTTDATSLFARVVDPFAVEASALKVTLKTKVSLGRSIQVDPELLGRVLSTLVEGALRNTPAGGSVVLTARHGHGVAVVLSVTADGEARVPPLRGHGLRFCRAAVESHGGSIGLVGDPATATCFRIVLPHA